MGKISEQFHSKSDASFCKFLSYCALLVPKIPELLKKFLTTSLNSVCLHPHSSPVFSDN